MRMSRLEKHLVNRPAKGAANIERVKTQLALMPTLSGGDALELGCGTGDVSAFLATERGLRVVGGDVDPEQVALARSRHAETPHLTFAVIDARRLEYDDATFDVVVVQNVLHHIPDWRAAVREIARVLRPGGYVLWLDVTTPAPLKPLLLPWRRQFGLYTARESHAAFRSVGLVERAARAVVPGLRYEVLWHKAA